MICIEMCVCMVGYLECCCFVVKQVLYGNGKFCAALKLLCQNSFQ